MSEEIRKKYEILEELLESERSAFKEQDGQKLAALALQIRKCSRDVADLGARFSELSLKEVEETRDLVLSIQKQLAHSRDSWRAYQGQLEIQRRQLQSSRRFCHQAKMRQRTRGSRISHTA